METTITTTSKPRPIRQMNGQPCEENCVAYCHHRMHVGALSADMMKNHECMRKNCKYLEKNLSHPYWKKREHINREKKANRDRNVQGTSWKTKTGSNVQGKASRLNNDLKGLLSSFENMDVYYTYIFYKDDKSKIRYLGGFYEEDIAKDKAKKVSDNEGGDYVVIATKEAEPVGFRLEPTIRTLIKIDLTWSDDYATFSDRVTNDLTIKRAANII